MNAGAHGGETTDVLVEARGVDRDGTRAGLRPRRHGLHLSAFLGAGLDVIFTEALFQGRPGEPAAILAEMDRITAAREASQPIREKTGGSTFKNPPGGKAWQLIDAAGCRGLAIGDAQMSEMHCNFLINRGSATARPTSRRSARRCAPACSTTAASASNGRSSGSGSRRTSDRAPARPARLSERKP